MEYNSHVSWQHGWRYSMMTVGYWTQLTHWDIVHIWHVYSYSISTTTNCVLTNWRILFPKILFFFTLHASFLQKTYICDWLASRADHPYVERSSCWNFSCHLLHKKNSKVMPLDTNLSYLSLPSFLEFISLKPIQCTPGIGVFPRVLRKNQVNLWFRTSPYFHPVNFSSPISAFMRHLLLCFSFS